MDTQALVRAWLVSAACSLDNLSVGAAYGLKGFIIQTWTNGLAATLNTACMVLSMLLGGELTRYLPHSVGGLVAACAFFGLFLNELRQLWPWLAARVRPSQCMSPHVDSDDDELSRIDMSHHSDTTLVGVDSRPGVGPTDDLRPLPTCTAISLAFVLSVSNLGCGVAAALAKLPMEWIAAATATCYVFSNSELERIVSNF